MSALTQLGQGSVYYTLHHTKFQLFKKFGIVVTKNYTDQRAKIWHFYLHTQDLQLQQISLTIEGKMLKTASFNME
jgi:hypothetical protein